MSLPVPAAPEFAWQRDVDRVVPAYQQRDTISENGHIWPGDQTKVFTLYNTTNMQRIFGKRSKQFNISRMFCTYRGTSYRGHSEIETTSLQRTLVSTPC